MFLFRSLIVFLASLMLIFPTFATDKKPLRIALVILGTLGDKSFFDSAAEGIKLVNKNYPKTATTKIIELGYDKSKWESGLIDVASGAYDLILLPSSEAAEFLTSIAPLHPTKHFIGFDFDIPSPLSNVITISFAENEGSFLMGYIASRMVNEKGFSRNNGQNTIGFIGGMDIPVVNNFLIGYITGARYVNPKTRILTSYIGSFADAPKGKELALAQYNQGATVMYTVAGGAGVGAIDASVEKHFYVLGVDSDQAMVFDTIDPYKASHIPVSLLKRLDVVLERSVALELKGENVYGKHTVVGLKDGAIALSKNSYYTKIVPADIRTDVDTITKEVIAGKIMVPTITSMTPADLQKLRSAAATSSK